MLACTNTAADSQFDGATATRIHSEGQGSPIYHLINNVRSKIDSSAVSIDYMVHPAQGVATPKAVLLLIAGGDLNAKIQGTDGSTPSFASGNFLVRSAHLFAAQGYKVITMDRPSDYADYVTGMDAYRVSMKHAVDIATIVNNENVANLPFIVVGTSRGAISAVANAGLAEAVAISGPVTVGDPPTQPVGSVDVDPANVASPAHVSWHVDDGCGVTPVSGSAELVSDFPDGTSQGIKGGFQDPARISDCNANSYHGFMGIESCAVGAETDWMDGVVAALPASRPLLSLAGAAPSTTSGLTIPITLNAVASSGGALTYTLPYTTTALGGTVSVSGNTVTYTAPTVGVTTLDKFAFSVSEAGAGKARGIQTVIVGP